MGFRKYRLGSYEEMRALHGVGSELKERKVVDHRVPVPPVSTLPDLEEKSSPPPLARGRSEALENAA